MAFVYVVAGIVLIAVVALLAVGRLGELPDVEPDRPPLALPDDRMLERSDVDAVRFAVGLRGYRMDEVDDVLDRLAVEVSERDARIAELEGRLRGQGVPRPLGTTPPADPAAPPPGEPPAAPAG